MNEKSRPEPPPEAALITAALKRSGLTARQAAKESGLSDARWRQIVTGYQSVSGSYLPVRAPDDRLALMARVVDVTSEQLREAGRGEAATELEELLAAAPSRPTGQYAPPLDAVTAIMAALPPPPPPPPTNRRK
ncbi:hypothetical protein OG322_26135 [Streptomyces sp. NBC_01260]|uniref:hypothetical protein n=1 Tax=Streptomyces sp. NBC_01260 TaxID=2903801 RepID=UPI002E34ADD7|nr:hypothetical protein [Streptomyces sp. NBC_01260]